MTSMRRVFIYFLKNFFLFFHNFFSFGILSDYPNIDSSPWLEKDVKRFKDNVFIKIFVE